MMSPLVSLLVGGLTMMSLAAASVMLLAYVPLTETVPHEVGSE